MILLERFRQISSYLPELVPANKFLFAGTVPANKFLFAGTVPANNLFHYIFKTFVLNSNWLSLFFQSFSSLVVINILTEQRVLNRRIPSADMVKLRIVYQQNIFMYLL